MIGLRSISRISKPAKIKLIKYLPNAKKTSSKSRTVSLILPLRNSDNVQFLFFFWLSNLAPIRRREMNKGRLPMKGDQLHKKNKLTQLNFTSPKLYSHNKSKCQTGAKHFHACLMRLIFIWGIYFKHAHVLLSILQTFEISTLGLC